MPFWLCLKLPGPVLIWLFLISWFLSPEEMGEACVLGTTMARLSPCVLGLGQIWCSSAHL